MKTVVKQETLTSKTIEILKGNRQYYVGPFLFSVLSGSVSGLSLIAGVETFGIAGLGIATVLAVTSTRNHTTRDLVNLFTSKKYSRKELASMVEDGNRVQLGSSRYVTQKSALSQKEPSDVRYVTKDLANFEVKTYLKKTGKKLTVEQELHELPLTTWGKAFDLILDKEKITEPALQNVHVENSYVERYKSAKGITS